MRSSGVPDIYNHLMGFRIRDIRIAGDIQPAVLKRPCKGLGVVDNLLLLGVLKVVHFIGGQQQSQERAQMMVADTAGKGSALYGLPEIIFHLVCSVV